MVWTSLPAGGPRLKCSELLKHVMEVLQSPYSCSAYGEHYSSLLLKDILSVRKYWCDITPQQWHSQWDIYLNDPSTPFLLSSDLVMLVSVTLRSPGLVLSPVQLFIQSHQPSLGEQSGPHAGAGLLHAGRRIPQLSVHLLLQSAAKCQVRTCTVLKNI